MSTCMSLFVFHPCVNVGIAYDCNVRLEFSLVFYIKCYSYRHRSAENLHPVVALIE